ncbi:hypothetical protein [Chromatium okenii]|uniref:hypothetical protein n=1 Tax=Chromatium okenii TaxID=61644 RepID=UPI001558C998|nr:hypothetical protein [Chromatium okenii]
MSSRRWKSPSCSISLCQLSPDAKSGRSYSGGSAASAGTAVGLNRCDAVAGVAWWSLALRSK